MTARLRLLFLLLVGSLALASAADETPDTHAAHPSRTIVLDNRSIRPEALTMQRGELLVFENHSLHPITVTFEDPKDLREKIRCGLLGPRGGDEERAPWMLFTWDEGRLRAVIPPGRFASLCSLAPGTYSFTAARQAALRLSPAEGGTLPEKGQITVQ
jgi:hypothetical protein